MAKFCTKCGRALQEGEICSCQVEGGTAESRQPESNQTPYRGGQEIGRLGQQIPPKSELEKQASALAQNFFKKILRVIKEPITAGREMIMQADAKTAVLLLGLQGIFSAIFIMLVEGSLMDELEISTPYARIFFVTWLISVGMALALALLLKLGNAVIKIPVSYFQMLAAVSIRSTVLIPAIILSIIAAVIHMGIGIGLFVLINIWGFTAMVVTLTSLIGQEKLNKFTLIASVAILLFVLLAVFVLTRTIKFYIPDEILTFMSNLNDLEDLLSWL